MERHDMVFSESPSRHKPLRRSLSAQPEESTLSSSPYSTRKKLRAPGRSLTEIFSRKLDHSARASTDDYHVYHRRRTINFTVPDTFKLSSVNEDDDSGPHNRSLSEFISRRKISVPVYKKEFHESSESVVKKRYVTSKSVHEKTDHHIKRDFAELMDESILDPSDPSRKKVRIANGSCDESEEGNQFVVWRVLEIVCRIIFWLIFSLVLVFLLVMGILAFNFYQETACELRRSMKLPVSDLREQLSLYISGQEIAIDIITDSLKEIVPSRYEMPLILWMAGWTGSGKTQTTQILKDVMSNVSQVHVMIPSLLPQNGDYLHKEIASLFNRLDSCCLNLIIIDGWDEESNFPVKILKKFMLNFDNYRAEGYNKGKIIIVLSGTRGSQEINSRFIELRQNGKSRADLSTEDFAEMATALDEAKILNTVTKQYVFVPFLPLEAAQVESCIKEELQKLQKMNVLLKGDELQRITQQVLDQMNFVPTSHPLFADTGCKRVQPLLALLLSGSGPSQH